MADDAAGESAGQLLEQDFLPGMQAQPHAGVLVLLGRLGLERQEMLARIVTVIDHLPARRPEIGMHVEEVHVHGNLDAVPLQELRLEHFLQDYDLAVRHGREFALPCQVLAFRNHEEGGLPATDPDHGRDHDAADPMLRNEQHGDDGNRGADQVDQRQGSI